MKEILRDLFGPDKSFVLLVRLEAIAEALDDKFVMGLYENHDVTGEKLSDLILQIASDQPLVIFEGELVFNSEAFRAAITRRLIEIT